MSVAAWKMRPDLWSRKLRTNALCILSSKLQLARSMETSWPRVHAHVYTLRRWIAGQGELGRRYCPMCACPFLPFLLDESIRFCLYFSPISLASWKGEMPILSWWCNPALKLSYLSKLHCTCMKHASHFIKFRVPNLCLLRCIFLTWPHW